MDNNNRLHIRNKFKPKDNYEKNKERVKREMYKGTQGKREKLIAESKKNIKKMKEEIEKSKNEKDEIPSQIISKFISMEGIELNNLDSLTNEITLPTEITVLDLNKLINEKLKNEKEKQLYQFYINDIEIKTNIKETLKKIPNFSNENIYKIIYCPESLFKVKPLTRGGTILEGHTDSILTVQFSPNGNLLSSGGGDSIVKFWDMNTDTQIINKENNDNLNLHNNWILTLVFSPDNSIMISGDVDGYFCIWDIINLKPKINKSIKAHKKWITSISFKPLNLYEKNENLKFITSGKDGYLKMWDASLGKIIINIFAHEQSITKCIWSGENNIFTCSEDQTVKIFNEKFDHIKTLIGHSHWINTMAINTEFILRTGCFDFDKIKGENHYEYSDKILKMSFEEKVKKSKERYEKFKEKINSSEKIVTGSDDYTLILWDIKLKKQIIRMTGHQNIINDVKFSPNAFFLASASFDKSVKIWNGNSGLFLFNLRGHVGSVYQISWSPNSKMILSCSKDSTLQCWNIQTKKMMHNLPGHADEIYTVDWAPNGVKAASGSKDRRVRIWVN